MKFTMRTAEIFIPDGRPVKTALAETTHMGISAHQDDLEIMAIEGILACFHQPGKKFCGVIVTDGRGSPRDGLYRDSSDDDLQAIRKVEQQKAAFVGEYCVQVLLDLPSTSVKNSTDESTIKDILVILQTAHPDVVYTHNLADKHDTHVAVALRVIEALRRMPMESRPGRVIGCEVWRNLDWMVDSEKLLMDCSSHENLQMSLLGVFDSQVAGGKRYDLASQGRRRANATYLAPNATDTSTGLVIGMDLTPLIQHPEMDVQQYVFEHIDRFKDDVGRRLVKMS